MDGMGLPRDAITYSSVISALAKGKQWAHALQARPPPLPSNVILKPMGKQRAHVLQARQLCCHASTQTTMSGHLQVGWHAG